MGGGILAGALKKKVVSRSKVFVFDVLEEKGREIEKKYKVKRARSISEVIQNSEILLLAFKPQDLSSAGALIQSHLRKTHLVMTILAGVSIRRVEEVLGEETMIVRAMPNLAATVGEAVTALVTNRSWALPIAEKIFQGCGRTIRLEERFFNLVTALSGSGPAYFFYLIERLEREGIRHGLKEGEARLLAKQTAKGAALLADHSTDSARVLRDKVTSKGGTTEAALLCLEERQFPEIFGEAIDRAIHRAGELGR